MMLYMLLACTTRLPPPQLVYSLPPFPLLPFVSSPPSFPSLAYGSVRIDKVEQAGDNALGNDIVPAFWSVTSDVTKSPNSLLTDMSML